MNGTDDIFELNESLQKTVQETKITAEYIRKKIEEKLVTGGALTRIIYCAF